MKSEKYDYQKEWEEYRKRRNLRYLIFLSGIIFFPLGRLYFHLIGLDPTNLALQFFLIAMWGIAFLTSIARFNTWKCPHCRDHFFVTSSTAWLSKCQNCDLPKYYSSNFYRGKQTFLPRYYPRNKN